MKLCGHWLVNPDKYKWIQFETCPDEENQNKFYLDDIVCLDSKDSYCFYQIKYRQNPLDVWTWDDFLIPRHPRGKSLFNKWVNISLRPHITKTKEAIFISNAQASEEVEKYIDGEILNIQKIKVKDITLYNRIINEIGNKQKIDRIFKIFHFRFNQKNLTDDELERSLRKYFYNNLNATKSGFTNLIHEIKKECRKQNTSQLKIEMLRSWCEFDSPRSLEEHFDIPSDFEFFDNRTHQSILSDLQKPEGGIKVVFGKPGVGKSVYLSKLDKELNEKRIISIKHHYHISPEDTNPQERLNTERVIEAIKSQLKFHKKELGVLANKNSKNIPIREFITTIAKKLGQAKKAFTIIVDGLDHVLRYGAKEELETFLKEICFPQSGVWIVIGMQEHAKLQLPQIIFDRCPEDQWIEIKSLNKDAISKIIKANKIGLHFPNQIEQFRGLVDKLFSISEGNPLHLRFSLQQLKNMLGNSLVVEYSCKDLIPFGGGIETYYNSLWEKIPDNAQAVLLTMASVNFLFSEHQLIECVSSFMTHPVSVTNGFNQVSHLISINLRRQMSVYHNSFELFLRNLPEMDQQKIILKTNIKKWLEQSNYEYLKWAELKIIEYELGNSNPILELDRKWLLDAICYPCNSNQISKQIELSAKVAFNKNDFGKALQISHLYQYYLNSKEFEEEAIGLIWEEALHHNSNIFDYIDFKILPTSALIILAKIADESGNKLAIEEIIEIILERLDRQEYRQNTLPPITLALLKVLPYDRQHNLEKVYKYIVQFRDIKITDFLFGIYSHQLLILGQKEKLGQLLKLGLTEGEREKIVVECVKYGFVKNDDISSFLGKIRNSFSLYKLYSFLKNRENYKLPPLSQYDIFPYKITEGDTEERAKWKSYFYEQFLIGLLYGIADKTKYIIEWVAGMPIHWPVQATGKLLEASIKIASGISQSRIVYSDLFNTISNLKELVWPEDRNIIVFQYAFSDAIIQIFDFMVLLNRYFNCEFQINLTEYSIFTSKPLFFSKDNLIDLIVKNDNMLLKHDLYQFVQNEKKENLSTNIIHFPDRAIDYAKMSKLARLYTGNEMSQSLLLKAADNLLGYGNHKDIYLFDVLEAIKFCAQFGKKKEIIDGWIARIIPIINSVDKYTDGDETHGLPSALADLLAKHNPALLKTYYYWSAEREELYHAEDLFKFVIKSLSFTDDVQIALASTALDKESFLELKAMSQNNVGALEAFNLIESYLGQISYLEEKESSSSSFTKSIYSYSEIEPNSLINHLSTNFENKWEWNNYLVGWINYWQGKIGNESIYRVFRCLIEKSGMQFLSGQVLDLIYPLIYEFDNSFCFDLLCKAQEQNHGWQRYWYDEKEAENRWNFVKKNYPQRYLDFFHKSTNHYFPLSRGVEFLFQFGDFERAEAITNASVQFVESLMADIDLPIPIWFKEKNIICEIDVLIQRLLWPSPLVRERAACGIARLLCSSENKKSILTCLLSWTKVQKMETIIAIGLLPIIKAFYIADNSSDLNYINVDKIAHSILINSEVIEKLFNEIYFLTGATKQPLPSFEKIDSVPDSYLSNSFFEKYLKTFLTPIYLKWAEEIEKQCFKPFIRQWAFTAEEIIKLSGIELDANQRYFYARSEHDEFLLGFSSKVSEAYRSAFLRILQSFFIDGDIAKDFYLEYVYATLPIELSKWKILPNRAPRWWPKLTSENMENKRDASIIAIQFENPLEYLIKNQEEELIIAAEGAIQPADGWRTDPSHSFSLKGFGYKVIGPKLPTPEEVAKEIFYAPHLIVFPSKSNKPFNLLEDKDNHFPVNCNGRQIEDLLIFPIVTHERDLCIELWQYFRDYNVAFNLNPILSKDLIVEILDKQWQLRQKNKKIILKYEDWLEGLKERYYNDMPLPHGQYLKLNKLFINNWLNDNGLRLGFLLKMTYRSKKYSYEKAKIIEEYKILNLAPLITL